MWKQKTSSKNFFFPKPYSHPHTQTTFNITLGTDQLCKQCYRSKSVISSVLCFPALFYSWKSICTIFKCEFEKKNTITVTHTLPHAGKQGIKMQRTMELLIILSLKHIVLDVFILIKRTLQQFHPQTAFERRFERKDWQWNVNPKRSDMSVESWCLCKTITLNSWCIIAKRPKRTNKKGDGIAVRHKTDSSQHSELTNFHVNE